MTTRSNTGGGFFGNYFSKYQEEIKVEAKLEPICKTQKRLLRINRKLFE
jgi:hypothetical protein